tara:strand:- start:208 stop:462 length:255 start_codon:yes stop_codon:yes gene_type:complete
METTSGWVKTCLWFPIGTAIMILIAGLQREMSITILAILSIINIAGPCYLLLKSDYIKKKFSHIFIIRKIIRSELKDQGLEYES